MATGLANTIKRILNEDDSGSIQKKNLSKTTLNGGDADIDEAGDFETIASAPGADDAANLSRNVKRAKQPQEDPLARSSSSRNSISEDDDDDVAEADDSVEIEFDEEDDDTFPNIFDEEDDDVSEEDDELKEDDDKLDEDDDKEVSEDDDKLDEDDDKEVSEDEDDVTEEDDELKEGELPAGLKKYQFKKKGEDKSEEADDEVSEDDDKLDEDDDYAVDEDDDLEEDAEEKKAMSEQLRSMFASSLNEQNQAKVIALFETYTSNKIRSTRKKLYESMQNIFRKRSKRFETRMVENLDKYLDYVVEEWVKQNKLAAKRNIRTEIAEAFITDLAGLMRKHNFDVPNGKRDLLQTVLAKAKRIESSLSEEITNNANLKRQLKESKKALIFLEKTRTLSDIQRSKALRLAESLTFTNAKEYGQKITTIINEHVLNTPPTRKPTKTSNDLITEDVTAPKAPQENLSDEMAVYVSKLSKVRPDKLNKTV